MIRSSYDQLLRWSKATHTTSYLRSWGLAGEIADLREDVWGAFQALSESGVGGGGGSGVRLTGCIAQNAATGFENALEFEYTPMRRWCYVELHDPCYGRFPNSDFTGVLSF